MPKFHFEEAVWGHRTFEVRAANFEEAEKIFHKHGADGKSRDCRVIDLKYFDTFLTEARDDSGKLLHDYLPVTDTKEPETYDGTVRPSQDNVLPLAANEGAEGPAGPVVAAT
jgi:hypothetical protein